jgi:hypothetical protein
MNGQQAVRLIDRLLDRGQQRKLNDIQSTIVLQIWEGNTYRSIADRLSYDLDYIKQIAARLWKILSQLLSENICKSNIKSVLERCQESIPVSNWDDLSDSNVFINEILSVLTVRNSAKNSINCLIINCYFDR